MEKHLLSNHPKSNAGQPLEKNRRLGQIFTPLPISSNMVAHLFRDRPNRRINILEPCVGPATFLDQIVNKGCLVNIDDKITAIDIDNEMISETRLWANNRQIKLDIRLGDYLKMELGEKYDYVIMNPPYIRQEWINQKDLYRDLFLEKYGTRIPGTSNLYVYFLVKSIKDLVQGGSFAFLVYDSWQYTRYGKWLEDFLSQECENLSVESLHSQPFDKKLIDATIIYGARRKTNYSVLMTPPKKSHESPFSQTEGFTPLDNVFNTKRGLRLKQTSFFLTTLSDLQLGATPFIKKVGKLSGYSIPENHPEAALLLVNESGRSSIVSELTSRLIKAERNPDKNKSILTWVRERPKSWMLHPSPPHAPILFNYYLRNRPRHIYNKDRAYADNFYGLIAKREYSIFSLLAILNSTSVCIEILARARSQGYGLAKIQLFEYRSIYIPDPFLIPNPVMGRLNDLGLGLIENPQKSKETIAKIDDCIGSLFEKDNLKPSQINDLYEHFHKKN